MYYNSHFFTAGNSQAIRIPKKLLEFLGFRAGEKVIISADKQNHSIIIKKASQNSYKSIKELFAGYDTSKYMSIELDTDKCSQSPV